jgi:hypothetical protein
MPKAMTFTLLSLLCLSALACSAPAEPTETSSDGADALTAATDPVYIANAKTFFEALVNDFKNRDTARITYEQLPKQLEKTTKDNNPDPNAGLAAQAFETKVKNAKGHLVIVYGIMDGFSDEGETITLYTSSSKEFAEGDDYRGFVWNH